MVTRIFTVTNTFFSGLLPDSERQMAGQDSLNLYFHLDLTVDLFFPTMSLIILFQAWQAIKHNCKPTFFACKTFSDADNIARKMYFIYPTFSGTLILSCPKCWQNGNQCRSCSNSFLSSCLSCTFRLPGKSNPLFSIKFYVQFSIYTKLICHSFFLFIKFSYYSRE